MQKRIEKTEYVVDDWHGCYRGGWSGILCEASFQHPAKVSRPLAERIYAHAFELGWLQIGSVVMDPFGGIAGFAWPALWRGVHFVGVELEEKFVRLGNENISEWNRRYGHKSGWGTARLLKGDSRNLSQVLSEAAACVSSPPFAQSLATNPPNVEFERERQKKRGRNPDAPGAGTAADYGQSEGQLGAMQPGDIQAAISSPPYVESLASDNPDKRGGMFKTDPKRRNDKTLTATYGTSDGQLSAMKGEGFDGAISSPPYEGSLHLNESPENESVRLERKGLHTSLKKITGASNGGNKGYGGTDGQLGESTGDTFWSAARTILEQTYSVLAPGACAIWVCKDFIRNKKRVPFSDQWAALCEAVGFKVIHRHRAWLVESYGSQFTLDGEEQVIEIRRVSFFRRLAEKKGSPKIEWEDVICTVK